MLTFRCDKKLRKSLKLFALENDISVQALIENAISRYIGRAA